MPEIFETVFHTVRYINNTGKVKISDYWIKYLFEEINVEGEFHYGIITNDTCIYILKKNDIYTFYGWNKQMT